MLRWLRGVQSLLTFRLPLLPLLAILLLFWYSLRDSSLLIYQVGCDNIGGECYENTEHLPIDVLYTWVNGSDPLHRQQMEHYRNPPPSADVGIGKKLRLFTGRSLLSLDTGVAADSPFEGGQDKVCPIEGCIAAPAIVSTSAVPENSVGLETIQRHASFADALDVKFAVPENSADRLLFIKFSSIESAQRATRASLALASGGSVKFTEVYYSFQAGSGPHVRTSSKLVRTAGCNSTEGIISLDPDQGYAAVARDSLYSYRRACPGTELLDAFLVWPPWGRYEVGSSADSGSHRYADNEELRYSLRSLLQHAPWVRRVYLLTNGQVPSWLDTSHPRLHVVTHEDVYRNRSHLPTFSSPSIEANMLRVPGLSEHFLYFNDDVFLGRPVAPSDFVSSRGAYKVYLAWNIPNCNTGCPSNWLTDGYCDLACNVSACSFDGGDCRPGSPAVANLANNLLAQGGAVGAAAYALNYCNPGCSPSWVGDKYCDPACNVADCGFDAGDCGVSDVRGRVFEVRLGGLENGSVVAVPRGVRAMYLNVTGAGVLGGKFEAPQIIRTAVLSLPHRIVSITFFPNQTTTVPLVLSLEEEKEFILHLSVDTFPAAEPYVKEHPVERAAEPAREQWQVPSLLTPPPAEEKLELRSDKESHRELRSEKDKKEPLSELRSEEDKKAPHRELRSEEDKEEPHRELRSEEDKKESHHDLKRLEEAEALPGRHLLDTFADSLHHVNNLYNGRWGKSQRKVISHMPFLVNKTILANLHSEFPAEFEHTSAARFRTSEDMQFAFSYYYYLIHSVRRETATERVVGADLDRDGLLSSGELSVLLARLFPLPVSAGNRTLWEEALHNCTQQAPPSRSSWSVAGLLACESMAPLVRRSLREVVRYGHDLTDDREVTFKMLKSNLTKVRRDLDAVRFRPKKFVCLNDNMDHGSPGQEELGQMLREFYQTLFPEPSSFELAPGLRNTHQYIGEIRRAAAVRARTILASVLFFLGLLALAVTLKWKSLRKCWNFLLFKCLDRFFYLRKPY